MIKGAFETKMLTVPEFYTSQGQRDLKLSFDTAHFRHADDCQFIFYVGDMDTYPDQYKEIGFTKKFCKIMTQAHKKGFDYVRLTD